VNFDRPAAFNFHGLAIPRQIIGAPSPCTLIAEYWRRDLLDQAGEIAAAAPGSPPRRALTSAGLGYRGLRCRRYPRSSPQATVKR